MNGGNLWFEMVWGTSQYLNSGTETPNRVLELLKASYGSRLLVARSAVGCDVVDRRL
jgi:hypothetical protein